LKQQLAPVRAGIGRNHARAREAASEVRAALMDLHRSLDGSDPGCGATIRDEVARLDRAGRKSGEIAAALDLPLGEVSLRLKLVKMGSTESAKSFRDI
jgi:DNA-directed RNA polymerase specialized sigma24 family protein